MNIEKALKTLRLHLSWLKGTGFIPYEKLNTPLLRESITCCIGVLENVHNYEEISNMNLSKAIIVCNNHLQWSKTGNHIPHEELNTTLFQHALQYLLTLAQEVEKEGNGLADK